jgi:hypothetical protein
VGGTLDKNKVWIPTHEGKNKIHLWTPLPAVADAALEELLKARHKRTDTFHVVLIPRLMAPRWHQLFNKVCDFTFLVSPGFTCWPDQMHEPLWVGIILPFCPHRPWCFKRAPFLVELARDSREVLSTSQADGRDILRKLLKLPQTVAHLSERMACGVLHIPGQATDLPNGSHRGQVRQPMAQRGGKAEEAKPRS